MSSVLLHDVTPTCWRQNPELREMATDYQEALQNSNTNLTFQAVKMMYQNLTQNFTDNEKVSTGLNIVACQACPALVKASIVVSI